MLMPNRPAKTALPLSPKTPEASPLQMRPLTPQDTPALVALHKRCLIESWSAAVFASALENPLEGGIGLFEDTTLRGFIMYRLIPHVHAEILTFAVDPHNQGRGYGHQILNHLMQTLLPPLCVLLEVNATNTRALALYTRCGFIITGHRKGYYAVSSGPPQDALMMECQLAATP